MNLGFQIELIKKHKSRELFIETKSFKSSEKIIIDHLYITWTYRYELPIKMYQHLVNPELLENI